MKRKIIVLAAILTVALTACGGSKESETKNKTAAPNAAEATTELNAAEEANIEETNNEETTESTANAEPEADGSVKASLDAFPFGVWIGTSEKYGRRYYSFYGDIKGGNVLFQDSGIGVGFNYEIDGDNAVFHVGDMESSDNVQIVSAGDAKIEMIWKEADGDVPETLEFYSQDIETFDFTENDTLCEKALNFYEQENGKRPELAEIEPAENGMMLIHVHDQNGDHDALYTVSPMDCKGLDNYGSEVDLSNVPMG